MAMAWTKEQQAAIDSRGQTLLLSAAAGSGKTAVLVERIIQRLLDQEHPADITQLLVVTFTKAAAAEMRDRVAAALMNALSKGAGQGDAARIERQLALLPSAHISTLHSFCQDVIRRYFYRINIDPAFTIAGQEELSLLRRNVLENVFLAYYEDDEKAQFLYPLADMFGNDRGDDALMDTVGHMYDYSRSMPWPEQWLHDAAASYEIQDHTSIDDLPWCAPMKQQIQRTIREKVAVYDACLLQMKQRPAFAAAAEQFMLERTALQDVLQHTAWDGMGKAVRAVEFPRLKAVRNLSDDDKVFWETCKSARNTVKKDITESLQQVYFTVPSQAWIDGIRAMAPMMKGLVQLTKDFAAAYEQAKQDKGWIDFSDLEHYCLQILLDSSSTPQHSVPSAAAEELRQLYIEVLIDEYQDTNGVQELITRLVSTDTNRFMVGDIKQSIYRFRLADPTLFLNKYMSFSRAEGAAQRCIDLSKNFRSAANILDAVNEVFAGAMTKEATGMEYGDREKLYAGRPSPTDPTWAGGPIEVHLLDTDEEDKDIAQDDEEEQGLTAFEKESRLIAQRIIELKSSGVSIEDKHAGMVPLSYRHIVVLLRSMTGKAEVLLEALQAAGIPAYAEQNGGYFAASEVQVMLSLLRCIDNPEQDLPMAAVLRSALCGMDEAGLSALRLAGDRTLWQNLPVYIKSLDGDKGNSLQCFYDKLETWRTFSRRHGVAELLQCIYSETAYYDYVGGMPGGSVRQANLQALYNRAGQYEAAGFRGIFRYLKLIDKMQDDGIDLAPAKVIGENEDVVRIMSIHKSKGLEFPVVIIADMGKTFNRQDMQSLVLFHNTLGIGIKQYDPVWRMFYPTFIWSGIAARLTWESTAEEERVLYVAMTRARDKLILTGHSRHLLKDWQRWQSHADPAQSHTYFDWVMPVLANQEECQLMEQAIENGRDMKCCSGSWQVILHHGTSHFGMTEAVLQQEPRLQCLKNGVPSQTVVPDWMDAALSWQYGYATAVTTPAKLTVTEIKRQYGLLHDDVLREEASLAVAPLMEHRSEEDSFEQLPPWLQEEEEITSGAKRGTILHKVMQYLPVCPDMTDTDLRQHIAQWEIDGIFTDEEAKWVYVPAVLTFCQSELGKRMAQSPDVRREYPFSVLFSRGIYLPDIEEGEEILLQGVVDCLFREGEQWVLIDYKTDHLDTEDDFRKRYAVQLALYKRAVEQISGVHIRQVYIYSFHLNTSIQCV
jgi:ATP-dependent helicase/nuclease subunit A